MKVSHAFLSLFLGSTLTSAAPASHYDCTGTANNAEKSKDYICGDENLGLILHGSNATKETRPSPKNRILDCILRDYDPLAGMKPGALLSKYKNENKQWIYPYANGFSNFTNGTSQSSITDIPPGTSLDRFGSENGSFLAILGTSYGSRALPPSSLNPYPAWPLTGVDRSNTFHIYHVKEKFEATAGMIAPGFGQTGEGMQFMIEKSIRSLIDDKKLEEVTAEHVVTREKGFDWNKCGPRGVAVHAVIVGGKPATGEKVPASQNVPSSEKSSFDWVGLFSSFSNPGWNQPH
ncbi:hypothetical protein QQS21_000495 [Conoideocrella luteorostrata]|uniref:TNT domain-containing protein n=1 Tax=Conoideocrella luteorostrata TaxID=1105319 RepID=A0AAJ0G2K8_9HYPO|nr:hypothetical protein QQS21_000495 [Conoideocrella luteorostrata]